MTKVTKDRLAQHLTRLYLDTLTPQLRPVDFEVKVSYQGADLYKFEELYMHLLFSPPNNQKHDLMEVLDKSGMYELEIEFNPSSEANIGIDNERIELPNGTYIPSKIRSSDPTLGRWFQQACSLLGTTVHLIPDTNVTRRLYYTNHLRHLLIENSNNLTLSLSRLAILEIESMYNRNKASEKVWAPNTLPKDKDAYDQNEKRKEKERRFAFQSMGEILSMKRDGAKVLPPSDMSLIRSFSSEAGKGNADAAIRREVSNSKPILAGQTRTSEGNIKTSSIAFLTCDQMNSLAAIAEDLNTIYFYRLEDSISSCPIIDHNTLSWLIFNTAIHFGECDIIVQGKGRAQRYKCNGIWSGKSVYDWQNHIVDVAI